MGLEGVGAVRSSLPHLCPFPHTLQKVVLSSGSGPGLDLPLVLGLPLQLKLTVSGVVLSQGGLFLIHVDAGAGYAVFGQGLCQGVDVDHIAACGVDEQGGGFHEGDEFAVYQVVGVCIEWHVEGYDVAAAHKRVEVGVGGTEVDYLLVAAAVVGQHCAAKGTQQADGGGADGSGADHSCGLAMKFMPQELFAAAALARGLVKGGDAAQQVEHQAYGQFADRYSGVAGCVLHRYAVLAAIVQVYVVQACEGYGEVLQLPALA